MTSKKNLSLPWTLRKHKGSVACYSDIVNASGYPLACVHDDYAAAIVDAVNGQAPQEATEPRCENCHEILTAHVSCNYCGHPQRPHEPGEPHPDTARLNWWFMNVISADGDVESGGEINYEGSLRRTPNEFRSLIDSHMGNPSTKGGAP